MYTYCLFCETGKSMYVAREVKALFKCRIIIPKQIQHTWYRGEIVNRVRELLPGYVFVYSEIQMRQTLLYRVPGIIRCLRTTDKKAELKGADEAFALFLLESDGVIGKTKVIREGDRLEIGPESFRNANVTILKVDHRARRMQVEICFAAQTVRTWIEYEEISPEEATHKPEDESPENETNEELPNENTATEEMPVTPEDKPQG